MDSFQSVHDPEEAWEAINSCHRSDGAPYLDESVVRAVIASLYRNLTTPPRPFDNPIPAPVVEEMGKLQAKVEELTEKCYSAVRMLIDAHLRGDRLQKALDELRSPLVHCLRLCPTCGAHCRTETGYCEKHTPGAGRRWEDVAIEDLRGQLAEKNGALAAVDRALEVSRECERAAGDALAAAQATIGSQAEELRQSRRALADSETGRLALRAALQKNEPGGNLLKLVELEHRVAIALVVLADERRAPANRARDGMKALRGEPFTP